MPMPKPDNQPKTMAQLVPLVMQKIMRNYERQKFLAKAKQLELELKAKQIK